MRIKILFFSILLAGCFGEASDFIIDPELMNQETWAQPHFPSSEELSREPSSEVAMNDEGRNNAPVKNADEYLDVLKSIPASEPTISKAWLEYKVLHEN